MTYLGCLFYEAFYPLFCCLVGGPEDCYLRYQREGTIRELTMTPTRILDCVTGCDGWEDKMEVASRRFAPPRKGREGLGTAAYEVFPNMSINLDNYYFSIYSTGPPCK